MKVATWRNANKMTLGTFTSSFSFLTAIQEPVWPLDPKQNNLYPMESFRNEDLVKKTSRVLCIDFWLIFVNRTGVNFTHPSNALPGSSLLSNVSAFISFVLVGKKPPKILKMMSANLCWHHFLCLAWWKWSTNPVITEKNVIFCWRTWYLFI